MLRRFDVPGPRYTSYPTADRFVEAFGPAEYRQALASAPKARSVGGAHAAVAVRAHPVLRIGVLLLRLQQGHHPAPRAAAAEYLDALAREIDLHVAALGPRPAGVAAAPGRRLADLPVRRRTGATDGAAAPGASDRCRGAEISIEVDPRTATHGAPARTWPRLGFNRLSFGVQDFDPEVQKAVHRVQPYEQVRDLMAEARALGFESINADLIYGLPLQTPDSFARTIAQVADLRPDRIALYAYAHLPQRFKPQRRIDRARAAAAGRATHADAVERDRRLPRRTATSTSAWTTSRCPTTRSRWPSARAGCTATSRATARSPTAT